MTSKTGESQYRQVHATNPSSCDVTFSMCNRTSFLSCVTFKLASSWLEACRGHIKLPVCSLFPVHSFGLSTWHLISSEDPSVVLIVRGVLEWIDSLGQWSKVHVLRFSSNKIDLERPRIRCGSHMDSLDDVDVCLSHLFWQLLQSMGFCCKWISRLERGKSCHGTTKNGKYHQNFYTGWRKKMRFLAIFSKIFKFF